MTSTPAPHKPQNPGDSEAPGASDNAVFAQLETAFGETLTGTLKRYLDSSNELCERLQDASACAHWQEAVRVAILIGEEADALGFHRVATAARSFADATYHADRPHQLRNGAQLVVFEYERFRLALEARFTGLVASEQRSVA